MYMFFKKIINFFMWTIFKKGSNFCFFPFTWEYRINDTMIANKSDFIRVSNPCPAEQN